MIYPPSQKPPIWSIDSGVIAYNCQRAGMPPPIGAWPMWEGAGNRALDYSGHGNHGVITGADWVADGIDFVAANTDYVDTNHYFTDDIRDGDFSISARIKPTSSPENAGIFAERDDFYGGGGRGFVFQLSAGTLKSSIGDGTNYVNIDSNGAVSVDSWHSVTTTWNRSSNMIQYVDGVAVQTSNIASVSGDISQNTYTGKIGKFDTAHCFDGIIDTAIIFNTALSVAQVKFISYNPYFMYQIPEESYGYVAAAPPVGNPFWYYNMLKRRN